MSEMGSRTLANTTLRVLCVCIVVTLVVSLYLRSSRGGLSPISESEVIAAQRAWGDGIVAIGQVHTAGGDVALRAGEHIDRLYGYAFGTVLFKPTKAARRQFRGTRDAALSYFVGGNSAFPEDKGFALQPWTKVRFENTGVSTGGHTAVAMGNYYFTDTSGGETKVEYTFGYTRYPGEGLRIAVHHSSLPYAPTPASGGAITEEEVKAVQRTWGEGIVDIGREKTEGGDYKGRALRLIDELYGFKQGPVLFKPTKARERQFRGDRSAALSYFVGGNPEFHEDKGFALQPWTAVRFENAEFHFSGNTATSMGNYYFTDTRGLETKVEYTFGYLKHGSDLRIFLHHSSLPYSGR
eukprot:Hpha_TRINITY_DN29884_c0_g1::TRINITY_DN29884_c0_g1_i1::g.2953::m.2953